MNFDPFIPPLAGCEVFQQQLSEAADAHAPLSPDLKVHLQSCAECGHFAEIWFSKPPAILIQPVSVTSDDELRERILEAASRPEIIPFPVAVERRASWTTWISRAAACLVLTGLAWFLLNPMRSQVKTHSVSVAEPTLAQSLARMEDGTKHEQQILQTALADGGQHVRGDVEWTLSALEL